MRKPLIILFFCLTACNISSTEQKRAEKLVKAQLNNFNHNSNNYQIISFKDFHPNYTNCEDDTNYDKYANIPSKLDSIKKNYKPLLAGYTIYVKFKGNDEYGKFGIHTYLCAFDNKLFRLAALIEVDGVSI